MMERIALVDWDGTIRKDFTIRLWVHRLTGAGLLPGKITDQLERLFVRYHDNMLSHDDLARLSAVIYANSLTGLSSRLVARHAHQFLVSDQKHLFSFSTRLLASLHKQGIAVIVVSGAPMEILQLYCKSLRLKAAHGLNIESKNGVYTGSILENPGISKEKEDVVRQILDSHNMRVVMAMGNSPSDDPLFQAAPVNVIVNNTLLRTGKREFHIEGGAFEDQTLHDIKKEILTCG
jgi:phosphoserine phosphatase